MLLVAACGANCCPFLRVAVLPLPRVQSSLPDDALPLLPCAQVRLSNFDASSSAQRGDVDPDNSECIFVQAFRQLREAPAKAFRSMIDSGQDKVFEVRLNLQLFPLCHASVTHSVSCRCSVMGAGCPGTDVCKPCVPFAVIFCR